MKHALFAILVLAPLAHAQPTDRRALQRGTPCSWDATFRTGAAVVPCGKTEGTVLYSEGKLPKLKAHLQGVPWRGKNFRGDGTMINRWPGFEAVTATVSTEASWFDGLPCVVMQYAANAPIFPGIRDEIREVSPGVWLGRSYDGASGTLKGYFSLRSH